MIKVFINGFGRIGRLVFKEIMKREGILVVGVNDLTDVETLAHLLRHDSVHGRYEGTVLVEKDALVVDGVRIGIQAEANPERLKGLEDVDWVVESTGRFLDSQSASSHLRAGAKRVLLSAPAKGNDIPTIVCGVNEDSLRGDERIVSNASCTTNCLAPMVKVLDSAFGVERGYITTVHAYTADQRLQDAPHKDLRRARAAALSIIPTSTGAAKAVGLVLPHLKGRLDGMAMRVPVPDGSLTDLCVSLKREASADEVNAAYKEAAKGDLKGILQYSEAPLVSADIVGNPHSCVLDAPLTATQGRLAKVIGWYDNESGYAARCVDLIRVANKK